MTKQEQIKEMAKILHSTHAESVICIGKDCNFCKHADLKIFDDYTCIDLDLAEALHNEGYRKVDEARKETAKEILSRIKLYATDSKTDLLDLIDEIAKANGVEVEE